MGSDASHFHSELSVPSLLPGGVWGVPALPRRTGSQGRGRRRRALSRAPCPAHPAAGPVPSARLTRAGAPVGARGGAGSARETPADIPEAPPASAQTKPRAGRQTGRQARPRPVGTGSLPGTLHGAHPALCPCRTCRRPGPVGIIVQGKSSEVKCKRCLAAGGLDFAREPRPAPGPSSQGSGPGSTSASSSHRWLCVN